MGSRSSQPDTEPTSSANRPTSSANRRDTVSAERTLLLVADRLNQMYGSWTLADGPVLRGPGSTAVTVGGGDAGHLDLNFVLDTERAAETTIADRAELDPKADPVDAIGLAVEVWADTTAAAAIELLTHGGKFGGHYHSTEPGGFPGWHTIAGGLVGWGAGEQANAVQRWMLDSPPWTTLAPIIAEHIDRDRLNGVKFFLAVRAGYQVAEVSINGQPNEPCTRALLGLDWPQTTELSAAQTFILLAHREGEPA